MVLNIDHDQRRFRSIVNGKIRENLRKYITHGEMLGRQGKDLVSIPCPTRYPPLSLRKNNSGGVGQGNGEVGQPLGPGEEEGTGAPPAASRASTCSRSKSRSRNSPRSWPMTRIAADRAQGQGEPGTQEKTKYNCVRRTARNRCGISSGPLSKRCVARFRPTLITPGDPRVIPIRDDTRYRAWENRGTAETNAAVIYLMDVSGSMTDEQKEIVRTESFWIDTWLGSQYDGVESGM